MQFAFSPRRHSRSRGLGCLLACAGSVGAIESVSGQQPDKVSIDARRCMQIEAPAERLACFEAEVSAAPAAPAPAAPPPRTVDVGAAPPQAAPVAPEDRASSGNITSLQAREPNRYLITLDNGEVWEQRVAKRFQLRVGQHVRVEPSQWGSNYRLFIDGVNGFIQVARVR